MALVRIGPIVLLLAACNVDVLVLRTSASDDGGATDAGEDDARVDDSGPADVGGDDAGPPDTGVDPPLVIPDSTWTLSAGPNHSCAVRLGGLYCWGQGDQGQLGCGIACSSLTPVRVGTDQDWSSVVTGTRHSCGLKPNGTVACWGGNAAGQLGVGDLDPRADPTMVGLGRPARALLAGADYSCAILDDGALWCWGANLEGQLGLGDGFPGVDRPEPVLVSGGGRYTAAATGQGHTCAIAADGALYCWGRNSSNHLGLGPGAEIQYRTPQRVGTDRDWTSIAAGQETTCAIRRDHTLWCWGTNLADNSLLDHPTQLSTDQDFGLVRVDAFHLCALKLDGALFCLGRGIEGQLGLGNTQPSPTLALVSPTQRFSSIGLGRFHSCAKDAAGAILCTGDNAAGQLGVGDDARRNVYTPTEPFP